MKLINSGFAFLAAVTKSPSFSLFSSSTITTIFPLDKSETISLIEEFNPDEIAIEAPFFGKNIQSMLKLGRAQGIAMAAGLSREIPITEYSPKKIKMAITGNGNASKEQVAKMLQNLLAIKELPKNLDSTDGLAAAVCHFYNSKNSFEGTKYSSWSSFVNKNKDKIRGS